MTTRKGETSVWPRTVGSNGFDEDDASIEMELSASTWLRRVFDEHAAYVARALRYLGVPERDLMDACQEVFVVALRKHAELDPARAIRPWLYTVATNVARNARRTARRRPEAPEDAAPEPASDQTPELAALQGERRVLALRLLGDLPDEQREVFVLHDVEELTMQEITDALEIPLKTGYSRLRLARAALAKAVARTRTQREAG